MSEPQLPAALYSMAVGAPGQPVESWTVGQVVPGSELILSVDDSGKEIPGTEGKEAFLIVEMNPSEDGGVDVFALPTPNSKLHKQASAVIFNVSSWMIRRKMTIASGELWQRMRISTKENIADEHVASITSKWTGLPADMILDSLADIREELEEGEGEPVSTPAPVVASPPAPPAPALPVANGSGGPTP